MSDAPLFDPTLKKKKAKKQLDLSELDALDDAAAAAGAAPTASSDASAAAAPAVNTTNDLASTAEAAPAAPTAEDEDMFGGLKKKSKKKKAIPADLDFSKKAGFDLEAFEKELQDEGAKTGAAAADGADGAGADDEDLGDDPFKAEDGEEDVEAREVVETWHGTDRDYTYQELLGRVFSTLRAQNPALAGEKKKYSIVPPSVTRDGSKKTMFGNVVEICKRMHRQPEHVIQYLLSELGTEGSVDGSQRLIIKGRFQPKQIENVLRRYILEYVTCKTCKSPRTILKKENRIFFIACEACGSQRSVTTIRSGFQAQTGKRSKMRAQA
ncbi:Translation initiation factor 2, beta subunit (eIF-2beta) [Ceraceosorus bombacis]|uniref:Translation initiation factor 2, beta subunit (EIF-2beta) n=1 Tax=Ceraceosorus bombacis TaxID=401625 RepID=A0A0P1BJM9_9BASI|nr:Translation initiation factor 2, beta subunit (eIF-2beta) [Ceraceosorus bombacis]